MSVLSDKWIRKMSKEYKMISPFEEKQVICKSISYGLSSFGYDVKVSHKFKIPNYVLVICLGKSTYARCGIIVHVTPLEPGWEGYVTLEFSNTTPLPAKIYANEGVAQFIFLKGNEKPEVTYADRNGKYMGQTGVTLPKV